MTDQPCWAAGLVRLRDGESRLDDALDAAVEQLAGQRPDLALVFCAGVDAAHEARLLARVRERLAARVLCGCSARSVLGRGEELEGEGGLSFLTGSMPGTELRALRLEPGASPLCEGLGADLAEAEGRLGLVWFGDPWTCDVEAAVRGIDRRYPNCTQVGGLASGGQVAGENGFYSGDVIYRDGGVGVVISGGRCVLDAVVTQGCRPIGTPLFVTRARDHWLLELDGQPAAAALRELWARLSEREQRLAQQALFVGIEMQPERSQYGRGDFLVRNLLGADPERGGLAVGARPREGQVIQFHVRDAQSSAQDLAERLTDYRNVLDGAAARPEAALLFSCVGRGAGLYGERHHDSRAFLQRVADVPLGGFFCNGEIGPVAGHTFLHAYTSAFGVFCHRSSGSGTGTG